LASTSSGRSKLPLFGPQRLRAGALDQQRGPNLLEAAQQLVQQQARVPARRQRQAYCSPAHTQGRGAGAACGRESPAARGARAKKPTRSIGAEQAAAPPARTGYERRSGNSTVEFGGSLAAGHWRTGDGSKRTSRRGVGARPGIWRGVRHTSGGRPRRAGVAASLSTCPHVSADATSAAAGRPRSPPPPPLPMRPLCPVHPLRVAGCTLEAS
jgi:hypothetical protein